jgi:hypothetical protein
MKNNLSLILLVVLCAGCSKQSVQAAVPASGTSAPAAAAPAAKPDRRLANALRVQKIDIMDANGFEKPMAASFGFMPVGWRAQGGVQWGQQYACTNGYAFNWSAASPDGTQAIAILPQEGWATNNYGGGGGSPGCANAAITSVQQYIGNRLMRLKPGAHITGYRARPDIAGKLSAVNSRVPTAMGEMRTWVEAGEALFSFNEKGRAMSGVMSAAVVFSMSRMRGVSPGQTMDALSGNSLPAYLAVAPEGQLNLAFMEAIRQSFLPNPQWNARISGHNNAIANVALQENAKRSRIITETNDYISRLRQETAATRAESDDRRQREFSEVIRGTETYDNPNAPGGRVELSNLYDHAWQLNDGTYVLSNDAGFDPWKDLGVEGKRLQATK